MNIVSRLTGNAQVRTVQGDRQVVSFSVAVNDGYKNKQGEWVSLTEYFECSYWLSSKIAQYLTKGSLVELTGRVSARAWVDRNEDVHAGLNFHTSHIRLLAKSSQTDTAQAEKRTAKKTKVETTELVEEDALPF